MWICVCMAVYLSVRMLRNLTLYRITLFSLFLFIVNGVFGDELKSVSVMEGESVTLHTHLTYIRIHDRILWMFGPQEARIAEIYKKTIDMYDGSKVFADWTLWLDRKTGSLTIKNMRTSHAGLYKLQIRSYRGNSDKMFNVTVYAHLPDNPITNHTQHLNITDLCETYSDNFSKVIPPAIVSLVVIVLAAGLIVLYRKCKQASKKALQREEEEVQYMDTMFCRRNEEMKASGTGATVYSSVVMKLDRFKTLD